MSDHHLTLRANAAQATLDEWLGRRLRFGEADCVRMTASHLRRLGYVVKLPPRGSYRGPRGARAQLLKHGLVSVSAALDALDIERIAPAYAIVGDVIEMPSDIPELGALTIALGNGRVMGWHGAGEQGLVVMQPHVMVSAWRAAPRGA